MLGLASVEASAGGEFPKDKVDGTGQAASGDGVEGKDPDVHPLL